MIGEKRREVEERGRDGANGRGGKDELPPVMKHET